MEIIKILAEIMKYICLLGIVYAQSYQTGIFYIGALLITIILKEELSSC